MHIGVFGKVYMLYMGYTSWHGAVQQMCPTPGLIRTLILRYMHLTFSAPPSYIVHPLHITLVYTCEPTMQSFCMCSTHRDVRHISSQCRVHTLRTFYVLIGWIIARPTPTHQKHEDEADFEDWWIINWWNIIHNDLVDCANTLARHTISFR